MQCRVYQCACGQEYEVDCTPEGCDEMPTPEVKCPDCGRIMTPTDTIIFYD